MPIIHVKISSDTERDLHDLTALHPKLSISQVAGQLLDDHVAERLAEAEDTTMSVTTYPSQAMLFLLVILIGVIVGMIGLVALAILSGMKKRVKR